MTLLTPELQALVGRERTFTAPEALSQSSFRYFALALGDDNPRWRHGEAPPTFIVESNQFLDDRQALMRGGEIWEIEVPGTRLLRAGNEYEFKRPVREGDRITVTWRIADMTEKMSRSGASLLLLTSLGIYRDESGEIIATDKETFIYEQLP